MGIRLENRKIALKARLINIVRNSLEFEIIQQEKEAARSVGLENESSAGIYVLSLVCKML